MEMKRLSFALTEVKADDETRTIEGYGSVFGNVDSYGDIVMKGAFVKSIQSRMPKMLWQHNSDEPIGVWDVVEERDNGLYCKGHILPTTRGNDAYTLLKGGAISGLSIGFTTKKYSIDNKKNTRNLEELELYEVSPVTFPANEKANVMHVKSASDEIDSAVGLLTQACALGKSGVVTAEIMASICQLLDGAIAMLDDPNEGEGEDMKLTERQLEKRLRDVGFSQRDAKAVVAGGHKALLERRDDGTEELNTTIQKAINALKGINA